MEQLVRQKTASRLVLDGATLTPEQVYAVAHDSAFTVEPAAAGLKRVKASNALVKAEVEHKVVYGVTTGFGALVSERVAPEFHRRLQVNLLRSHASRTGEELSREVVHAARASR